jgi:hypothetical protein
MVIINLGNMPVDSITSQSLIQGVRTHLALVPLVLISDREDSHEIVSAVRAGGSGFIPTSTEPDIAVRALTFILCGGSFFPPAALMDLRDGLRLADDDDEPNPDDPGLPKGGRGPLNLRRPGGSGVSAGSARPKASVGTTMSMPPGPNKIKPGMNLSRPDTARGRTSDCLVPPRSFGADGASRGRMQNPRTCLAPSSTPERETRHGNETREDPGEVFRLVHANQ